MFAQTKITLPPGRHKIIILDEADRYSIIHYNNNKVLLNIIK